MKILTCKTCGSRKYEDEFYAQPKARNGRMSDCKECVKERARKYRLDNLEKVKEYDRYRGQLPHRKALRDRLKSRYTSRGNEWRERNPEKYAAHSAVGSALRSGRLVKPEKCERCSRDYGINAHHDDYSRPLDVVWLCTSCHGERHRELNAMKRAAE